MEDLANLILLHHQKDFDTWAKKPRANSPGLLVGELVYRIIEDGGKTLPVYKVFPEMGEQTFIRALRRTFPDIRLNGGNQTWYHNLLACIQYKHCNICNIPKHYKEFHLDKNNSTGIYRICSFCRNPKQKSYYKNNLRYYKKYLILNRKDYTRRNAFRRASKLKATPHWSDLDKIKEIYKSCPEGYVVDHTYPLISDWVCGLHVPENLQILEAYENASKGNRYSSKYHN